MIRGDVSPSVSGWLSYSLAKSERNFGFIELLPGDFDQRHTLNVTGQGPVDEPKPTTALNVMRVAREMSDSWACSTDELREARHGLSCLGVTDTPPSAFHPLDGVTLGPARGRR